MATQFGLDALGTFDLRLVSSPAIFGGTVLNQFKRMTATTMALALGGVMVMSPLSALAATAPKSMPKSTNSKLEPQNNGGQLVVTGGAIINGKRAITGATVFSDSRIEVDCASGSNVTVNLGRLGRVQLASGSQMILRFSDSLISGELTAGKAIVNNAAGVRVSITTPEGVSAADGKEAAALSVNTQKGTRCAPMPAKGGSSGGGSGLGAGAIAAILAGAGATAVITGVVATNDNNNRNRSVSLFRFQ